MLPMCKSGPLAYSKQLLNSDGVFCGRVCMWWERVQLPPWALGKLAHYAAALRRLRRHTII
jgi:hypothetical protein